MKILAIETSCDETAIAIGEFLGTRTNLHARIFSHIISSQISLHAKFGGIVPNLARREHEKNLPPLLLTALKDMGDSISNLQSQIFKQILNFKLQKIQSILEREQELFINFKKSILLLKPRHIDAIAVTYGPGLAPALWVGVNFAKSLAYLWNKPLIPVNHMAGHIFSAVLQERRKKTPQSVTHHLLSIQFPALALLVSGGHTELVLMKKKGAYIIIGETLDDAAGEAFDKVGRILGLGYPGGPAISAEVEKKFPIPHHSTNSRFDYRADYFRFPKITLPRPMLNSKNYDFSFSGLKTAVLYLVRDLGKARAKKLRPYIAKEFQDAVVEVLVKKTIRAAKEHKVKTILLGGGVAANNQLRSDFNRIVHQEMPHAQLLLPDVSLTGDNALMIATAAFLTGKKKAPKDIGAYANLRLS